MTTPSFAEVDPDPKNPGGWIVWVAIADVAAYVRVGSALDKEAWTKANSVYFPDRVEPMLPERLSAGLCSLREGEPRATLAVRMVFGADGRKRGHKFVRGLMRSAAKLSYGQAQKAIDGLTDDTTGPLLEGVLKPLWAAYACVGKARDVRSPLDIDSPERRIVLNRGGPGRLHRQAPASPCKRIKLIEEMMIQANVCAAETLEQTARLAPDLPGARRAQYEMKLFVPRPTSWAPCSMQLEQGRAGRRPPASTRLLAETRGGPHAEIVNEVVLRTQMQAHYSPDNIGHFGLNLDRYAHFTSPIRRYADLIVHRALIRALKAGGRRPVRLGRSKNGSRKPPTTSPNSRTQAAMAAERDATDRYVAAFLKDRVGAEFAGRITGVTRFGLFIRLDETGADGLIPVSSLGGEYFVHDERAHALIGERSGRRWRLGARVEVRLTEATPITGGLLFEMLSDAEPPDPKAPRPRLGARQNRNSRPGRAPVRAGDGGRRR